MLNIIRKDDNSKVIVVTPLLLEDKIHKNLKISIKRNKIPFTWVTYSANNNIPTNVSDGLQQAIKLFKDDNIPKYILPIDNDITLGRNIIDRMYETISKSEDNVSFVYASFCFRGYINHDFPAQPYDINKLLQANYISSNSMIKIDKLEEVGGFVKDDKYIRLLDYCLWLKMFYNGYIGQPVPNASFVAISNEKSISAGSEDDYRKKYKLVYNDFILPILGKYVNK